MKTITLNIPDNLNEQEVIMSLAAKLYGDCKLTSGQAAALANMSKKEFIEVLGNHGVSIFNAPIESLAKDFKNAGKF